MSGICGFAGINDDTLLTAMTESIRHRGPDDFGAYQAGDVSFGHCRSSIIDLTGGRQPISNEDGSLTIVFDGEIYNYRELRRSLELCGHSFKTRSDIEVLLRLYEDEGPRALQKLNGMFAFAVHDRRRDEIFLARDRIGIKPLYYLDLADRFLFASETKALLEYSEWAPTINPHAIQDYLALRYVPGDSGMFVEVNRLPAGHYLIYRDSKVHIKRYWDPPLFDGPYYKNENTYFEEFSELMELSVSRRMISDVPIGAYLSGDLDSSVIVALMSKFSMGPVRTFSTGCDTIHDESSEAVERARLLGCDHTEIAYRASDISRLPEIVYHMDEPQGDPVSIPMFMLSKEAKGNVGVILSGEGGDEIFGGHLFHKMMWMGDVYRRTIPAPVRNQFVAPLFSKIPASLLSAAFQYPTYLGERGKLKALDYLQMLEPNQIDQAYRHLISLYDARYTKNLFSTDFGARLASGKMSNGSINPPLDIPYLNRLLLLQLGHWLPDNLLLRLDKMGMAHGIEGRVPYLDHELVEFAMYLPPHLKLHHLTGKYILRSYAGKLLPAAVTQSKRRSFNAPVEKFFEQPEFLEMMDDLLNDRSVRNRGIFQIDSITQIKESIYRNEFTYVNQAFSFMVLELWFRIFVDKIWVF